MSRTIIAILTAGITQRGARPATRTVLGAIVGMLIGSVLIQLTDIAGFERLKSRNILTLKTA